MENKFILQFFYNEDSSISIPVKGENAEEISKRIIEQNKPWISFPLRDKFTKKLGSEYVTINIEKVKYFKVEKQINSVTSRFDESDFVGITE
ncbi:hypothetical protein [Neobacillus terrae]|uniref:hypothetical protein n=1 Tax=Neobacillus terrae TaxID=3034837 RepID=UPI001407F8C1|nr:hypothetical protein [Neobacillus terrae]NHM31152.1 hypothetical protein [Neobacillus terrae]